MSFTVCWTAANPAVYKIECQVRLEHQNSHIGTSAGLLRTKKLVDKRGLDFVNTLIETLLRVLFATWVAMK